MDQLAGHPPGGDQVARVPKRPTPSVMVFRLSVACVAADLLGINE